MNYPSILGRYLATSHPETPAYSRHYSYGIDGTEYCELVGWPMEDGDPPTPEQVAAWEPPPIVPSAPDPLAGLQARLDALEEAREAGIRKLRTQVAGALLANGWSQADTMAAGRDFFSSKTGHGTAIRAYIDGAAEDFVADVLADPREWLDLPAGGGLSIRELFAEALGA